jgi:hypothetical protein
MCLEKVAQNADQSIFCEKLLHGFYHGKNSPIIRATSVMFTKFTQRKQVAQQAKIRPIWSP